MSVPGIEAIDFQQYVAPQIPTDHASAIGGGTTGVQSPTGPTGPNTDFGHLLLDGIDRMQGVQDAAGQLAVKAATGDLSAIHDYTLAATQAQVTTQLTVAVRNKALDAFNEIMRMSV